MVVLWVCFCFFAFFFPFSLGMFSTLSCRIVDCLAGCPGYEPRLKPVQIRWLKGWLCISLLVGLARLQAVCIYLETKAMVMKPGFTQFSSSSPQQVFRQEWDPCSNCTYPSKPSPFVSAPLSFLSPLTPVSFSEWPLLFLYLPRQSFPTTD